MTTRITIDEIKLIFDKLIQKAKNDKIEFIDIETDYYWIIMSDEWDDFSSSSSPIPSIGSLTDDWDSLQEVLKGKCIVTYLDYERLASIIRAFSEAVAPSKPK